LLPYSIAVWLGGRDLYIQSVPGARRAGLAQWKLSTRMPRSRSSRRLPGNLTHFPRTQLHPVDKIGLVNDLAHDCGPFGPDYNVVEDPVAGSFGVVADDVELDEPGVPESVNEFTWS
jgi:hypothetical protein